MNKEIRELRKEFEQYKENIKNRDYLIRTNFVGEIKDKELIEILKQSAFYREKTNVWYSAEDFETVKEEIIDYNFIRLDSFMEKLNSLILMQCELEMVRDTKRQRKVTVKKSTKTKSKSKKIKTKEGKQNNEKQQ